MNYRSFKEVEDYFYYDTEYRAYIPLLNGELYFYGKRVNSVFYTNKNAGELEVAFEAHYLPNESFKDSDLHKWKFIRDDEDDDIIIFR